MLRKSTVKPTAAPAVKRLQPALVKAITNNKLDAFKKLLSKYQDNPRYINAMDKSGHTALYFSVTFKRVEMVRLLLACNSIEINHQFDIPLTKQKPQKISIIQVALQNFYAEIFLMLLDDKRYQLGESGPEILRWALENRNPYLLQKLLERKDIDINTISDDKYSSLAFAINMSDFACFKLLLDYPGINVNRKEGRASAELDHYDPLYCAIKSQDKYIVGALLKHPDITVNLHDWSNFSYHELYEDEFLLFNQPLLKSMLCHPSNDRKWESRIIDERYLWIIENHGKALLDRVLQAPDLLITFGLDTPRDIALSKSMRVVRKPMQIDGTSTAIIDALMELPNFDIQQRLWNGEILLTWALRNHHKKTQEWLVDQSQDITAPAPPQRPSKFHLTLFKRSNTKQTDAATRPALPPPRPPGNSNN
jgi:hypothetical protein